MESVALLLFLGDGPPVTTSCDYFCDPMVVNKLVNKVTICDPIHKRMAGRFGDLNGWGLHTVFENAALSFGEVLRATEHVQAHPSLKAAD